MEGIEWDSQSTISLSVELIEKFHAINGFPWDQFDGVEDSSPNKVTLLDLAVTVTMKSNLDVMKVNGLRTSFESLENSGLKRDVEKFLNSYDDSVKLWENTDTVKTAVGGLIELIQKTSEARGWGAATLTKVLHRKRPDFVPMLDSIVRKAYCYGPRSDLWHGQQENVQDNSIAALAGFRTELVNHLSEITEIITLASDKSPNIVPTNITPVRCLEALVWWRDQKSRKRG